MTLRVLGCGDAFGSGGRLQTCFHIEAAGGALLLDCGPSVLIGCQRYGVDPGSIEAIVISHLHGDHFGGLPLFLLHAHHALKRRRRLTVAGPPGIGTRVEAALAVLFPGAEQVQWRFPLAFIELQPGSPAKVAGAEIRAYPVEHPAGAPSFGLRIAAGGRTLAFSGDTQWTTTLADLARDADLFICECYAYDEQVNHHMSYVELRPKIDGLGARRVLLTHLGASVLARRDTIDLECADDGMVIVV